MKTLAARVAALMTLYLKWGWPLLLIDVALETWVGGSRSPWRVSLNTAAFAWVLCAPILPIRLLLDRQRRERAMARLCGLREGDERERAITGEAARSTLLLALSLQVGLLVLTLVNVHLAYDPAAAKGSRGVLSVGLGFSSSRHLDPFGVSSKPPETDRRKTEHGGYVLPPSVFSILLLLILIQLASFKAFALRRYDGADA